jgi:hypothetical protein
VTKRLSQIATREPIAERAEAEKRWGATRNYVLEEREKVSALYLQWSEPNRPFNVLSSIYDICFQKVRPYKHASDRKNAAPIARYDHDMVEAR